MPFRCTYILVHACSTVTVTCCVSSIPEYALTPFPVHASLRFTEMIHSRIAQKSLTCALFGSQSHWPLRDPIRVACSGHI